jgi:hypothetical protein
MSKNGGIWALPSGYVKIAIENGHWNSEFSHEKWWFSIVMLVYQRVTQDVDSLVDLGLSYVQPTLFFDFIVLDECCWIWLCGSQLFIIVHLFGSQQWMSIKNNLAFLSTNKINHYIIDEVLLGFKHESTKALPHKKLRSCGKPSLPVPDSIVGYPI